MREILFRGKTQHPCGEWIYGSLLTNYPCCKNEIDETVKEYHIIDGKVKELKMVQVIPETIGQYTGLTDKNGKKIFEGDIIKEYGYENIYHIEYCDYYKYPAFDCDPEVTGCDCNGLSYLANAEIIEVIGNIHDNPELLKEGAADE